jgi:hypothetical protein
MCGGRREWVEATATVQGQRLGVGVNVDDEDVLEEDEVFGTAAILQYRANLRHPLVQPNSVLDALLNSTRGTELSGDRQLRYGTECAHCWLFI